MHLPLNCPECGKKLLKYQEFYMCADCHRVEQDCRGNLIFEKKSLFPRSAAEAKALELLSRRKIFSFLSKEIASILTEEGMKSGDLLLLPALDGAFCPALAETLPQSRVFALIPSARQAKFLSSEKNLFYCLGGEEIFSRDSFDAVISPGFCFETALGLLKNEGDFFAVFPGEDFARELFCYGFPKSKNTVPAEFPDFSHCHHFSLRTRLFLSVKEAESLFLLLVPKKPLPKEFKSFRGGFVTLSFYVFHYKKRLPPLEEKA